jgi:hypothetical protein
LKKIKAQFLRAGIANAG